jgi:hypothetical protein
MDLMKAIPFKKLVVGGAGSVDTGGSCTNTSSPRSIIDSAGTLNQYNSARDVPGVGRICTRWTIESVDDRTRFITVRSDSEGALARSRSTARFTNIRTCTVGAACL